eukprot:365255-Chlamydomonas_euryale.AAC.12
MPLSNCDEMHHSQLYRLRAITHACLGNYRGVAGTLLAVAWLVSGCTPGSLSCKTSQSQSYVERTQHGYAFVKRSKHFKIREGSGGWKEDANKVIELAPTIMDGYYHKGYALFNLKEYSDAAKAFQQGLRLHPNDKLKGYKGLRRECRMPAGQVDALHTRGISSNAGLEPQGAEVDAWGTGNRQGGPQPSELHIPSTMALIPQINAHMHLRYRCCVKDFGTQLHWSVKADREIKTMRLSRKESCSLHSEDRTNVQIYKITV